MYSALEMNEFDLHTKAVDALLALQSHQKVS